MTAPASRAGVEGPPPSPGAPASPGSRRAFAAAVAAVLALAALVRLVRWREAFWGAEVVPYDGDCLYHLRRALDVAAGRGLPTFDARINWPYGGPVPWAPGFDLLGGAAAWLFGAPAPSGAVAVAALPVILGILVVAGAMALAWRAAPAPLRGRAALSAGLLAAFIPQGVYASRFAQTDHHVAEALIAVALGLWSLRGMDPQGRDGLDTAPRRGLGYEAAGAGIGAAGVLFFTGTPLYVAIAVLPMLVAAAFSPAPRRLLGSGAPGLVAGGVVAAVLSLPLVASNARVLSFAFPSLLQPALLVVAGAGLGAAVLASRAGSPRRRAAVLAALSAAALAAAALVPGLGAQVFQGIHGWLLARDPWLSTIEEFQPVWSPVVGLRRVAALWGLAGLASPLLALAAAAGRRRDRPAQAAALLWQVLAFVALSALQLRFGRVAVPILAAAGGAGLAVILARLPVRPGLARALPVAVALTAVLADRATWRATAPAPLDKNDALIAAALDLRGGDPAEAAPGVLAPWDMGHEVNVIGARPVVANGFGTYLDPAGYAEVEAAYRGSEDALVRWMGRRRVGYLVAGQLTFYAKVPGPDGRTPLAAANGQGALDAVYLRGVPLAAAILGGSGLPDAGVPHLQHLMPRFASLQTIGELPFAVPVLWTFEAVPGARLRGRAAPGARVVLEVDLVERRRAHVWRAWTVADAQGAFELTVPLPTGLSEPTLATRPTARLRVGGGAPVPVEVPEPLVRGGGTLELGALGG